MPRHSSDSLDAARYARLRTFRADGTPVDTPIWFAMVDEHLVFRTKVGPKTRRLTTRRDVEVTACNYLGKVMPGTPRLTGQAMILSGAEAEEANHALHRRYGWQWNVVPMIKIPGVTNGHEDLCLREKFRRARDRGVWSDSAIVRVELADV